jgi:hypothetical protein
MNKTMKVPFLLRQGQITKADRTDLHTGDNSRRAQDSEKLIRKKNGTVEPALLAKSKKEETQSSIII